MKRTLSILFLGIIMTLTSCAAPLSSRMNDYVTEVEQNCSNWTDEQWELSQQEYQKLLDEYRINKDSYTQEEKDAINKAIGRYNGLLVKHGIEQLGDIIKGVGERIPSILEGFISAFEKEDNQQ